MTTAIQTQTVGNTTSNEEIQRRLRRRAGSLVLDFARLRLSQALSHRTARVYSLRRRRLQRKLAAIIGLAAIEASFFLFTDKMTFPGWEAALPVAGAFLLIMSEGAIVNRILALRPFVGVGLISYSLYLWHWPVLVFLHIYLFRPLNDTLGFVAIVVASGLSALTYFAVERPLRRRPRVLPIGAAMAAVGLFELYAALVKVPNLPGELRAMISASDGVSVWRVHECILLDNEDGDFRNCSESKRPLIAIWGDSTHQPSCPA